MSFGEINLYLKQYKLREEAKAKEQLSIIYGMAALTSQFTMSAMNGKPIPSIQEVFPTQFQEEQKENGSLSKEDELRMAMYKEQFIDFAMRRNKLLHKEGETQK